MSIYGYLREHRTDLKQWNLARASTHDGDVSLFLQPLDGSSDKVSLRIKITNIQTQLREAEEEAVCTWPIMGSEVGSNLG